MPATESLIENTNGMMRLVIYWQITLAFPPRPALNHTCNVCSEQRGHSLKLLEKIDGERIWAVYAKKFASLRSELQSVDRTSCVNRKSIQGNGFDLLKSIHLRQQAHAGIILLRYKKPPATSTYIFSKTKRWVQLWNRLNTSNTFLLVVVKSAKLFKLTLK